MNNLLFTRFTDFDKFIHDKPNGIGGIKEIEEN